MKAKALAFAAILPALLAACSVYRQEKELTPPMAEFLSKARYLITSEERRDFLALPDADKAAFVEAFWKRRDPDPATEVNELREEYEMRLASADKLFLGEGQAGFLTDRGRIYVLYGPPSDRQTNPVGSSLTSRCREVWYYANFPVIFVDQNCTGRFRLSTMDMTALRELNIAERSATPKGARTMTGILQSGSRRFDYEIGLTFSERTADRITASLRLSLPFGRIWFTSQGKVLRTSFDVAVELRSAAKEMIYETKASFPVSLMQDELVSRGSQEFVMEVLLDIRDAAAIAKLKGGDQLIITVAGATAKDSQKKSVPFN